MIEYYLLHKRHLAFKYKQYCIHTLRHSFSLTSCLTLIWTDSRSFNLSGKYLLLFYSATKENMGTQKRAQEKQIAEYKEVLQDLNKKERNTRNEVMDLEAQKNELEILTKDLRNNGPNVDQEREDRKHMESVATQTTFEERIPPAMQQRNEQHGNLELKIEDLEEKEKYGRVRICNFGKTE